MHLIVDTNVPLVANNRISDQASSQMCGQVCTKGARISVLAVKLSG